jgi:hypothetical protein
MVMLKVDFMVVFIGDIKNNKLIFFIFWGRLVCLLTLIIKINFVNWEFKNRF